MAFDQSTRNRLQKFVSESRSILTEEFTRQLQAIYGMDPKNGLVAEMASLSFLDNQGRQTAKILRETLEHYKASLTIKSEKERNKQGIKRIIREQSFTVLNRLGALRMAEARGFLLESIANGYSSKGFQLYKNLAGSALGETGDAYQQYLYSIFDEFSQDLTVLFDRNSSQGLLFPRESALLFLLDQINHFEIENLWVEDETIGWIYQYFNSQEERKKMRAESQAPRNSRELAVRNQFFTPRYVVEFLTDNTLGRIWYEMTQGKTALVENCRYLVRRPNEIFLAEGELAPENDSEKQENLSQEELLKQPVYVPFRELKDPRELRMLDPACGSMHFGLYAFDLFEEIYKEAWQLEIELGPEIFKRSKGMNPLQAIYPSFNEFRKAIPNLIIECNIHGVDIDPRAVQIAGLSLWQRAQRAWHQMDIKPNQRPTIKKSNIVCAEPMPGEKEMLREFTGNLNPPVLGQLVETIFDKMDLAGEAGTLLKIEEEIASTISNAKDEFNKELLRRKEEEGFFPGMAPKREATLFDFAELTDETSFWDTAEERILESLSIYADQEESGVGIKRLFAEDAAKGFAFIDLCRKRFDVVLMNPPFGDVSHGSKSYIFQNYSLFKNELYASFVFRGLTLLGKDGKLGAITSRTGFYLKTLESWRHTINSNYFLHYFVDLGLGVLDSAMVEAACFVIDKKKDSNKNSYFINCLDDGNKEFGLSEKILKHSYFEVNTSSFENIPNKTFSYWAPDFILKLFNSMPPIRDQNVRVKQGLGSSDNFRFLRTWWEVPQNEVGMMKQWAPYAKGGGYSPYFALPNLVVNWGNGGKEIKTYSASLYGSWSKQITNVNYYFRKGITYSSRTSSEFSPRILPEGCAFDTKGSSIFMDSEGSNDKLIFGMLAILNSSVFRSMLNLCVATSGQTARSYSEALVEQIPAPRVSLLSNQTIEDTMKLTRLLAFTESQSPCSHLYSCDNSIGYPLNSEIQREINLLVESIDKQVSLAYGISEGELEIVRRSLAPLNDINIYSNQSIKSINSKIHDYLIKVICGRSKFKKEVIDFDYGLFNYKPFYDEICVWNEVFECTDDSNVEVISSICELYDDLNYEDVYLYLTSSELLFDYHLKLFTDSKRPSPILWSLQTPSKSYTLWVYYHRLTDQTLFTCVNDFIEPKLKTFTDNLNGLRNKSVRSSAEEKDLAKLSDLETELKDFRDELLLLAKFWKPNLNDGVQITAAPLWKLFQHKQWQKKLKETWDKLEKGDYDWAHMAFNIWPERVLRKCHEDRSLAIAHDVENDFWEEVEIPVIRQGRDTGETKVEWQQKELHEDELKQIITQKIAELR